MHEISNDKEMLRNWFQIHLDVKVVGFVFVQLHQDHGRVRWLNAVEDVEGRKKSGHSDVMSRIHEQLPIGWGQLWLGVSAQMFNQLLHQRACHCTSSIWFYNREMTWKWPSDSWITSTETLHFQIVSFHLETKVGKFLHWTGKVLSSPFGQRLVETILKKRCIKDPCSSMIWFWNEIYFDKKSVVKVFDVINLCHIQATVDSQIIQHFLVAGHAFANVWWRVELGEELVITRALRIQYQGPYSSLDLSAEFFLISLFLA